MISMRFAFVLSEDSALLLNKVHEVLSLSEKSTPAPLVKHTFWGDEGLNEEFWNTLSFPNLIERFDFFVIRKANELNAETWKNLSEKLAYLREDAFVLFCMEGKWEKNKASYDYKVPAYITKHKCYTVAEKKSWFFPLAPLNNNTMLPYLKKGLEQRGLKYNKEVFEKLSLMLSPNASHINTTLEQLMYLPTFPEVRLEDLTILAPVSPELVLFDFISNLEKQNSYAVWQNILPDTKAEDILFPFLSLLTREARQLWQVLSGDTAKIPEFILKYKVQTAKRLGIQRIATLFQLCVSAEFDVKSGNKKVEQVLDELIIEVSFLYRL